MKKIVALIFISLCSLLGFSACSQPPSFYAEFDQEEYVLNVGEIFDAEKHLDLTGIDFGEIEISFSNEELFELGQTGFIANQSGETLVFAKHDGETLAQSKVYVNYIFDSPADLQISKEGVLSWSESVIKQGSSLIKPDQYIVEINQNRLYRVNDNCFSFEDHGLEYDSYEVRVQALGDESNHILSSQYSQSQTIVYNYVSMIAGLKVQVSNTFLNQQATLSWQGSEGLIYDVFFNGFKVTQSPLSTSSFTYDFSHYQNGTEITVEIVAYDTATSDAKLSVSHIYKINKLQSVDASYVYDQGDGFLKINDNQNATGYIIHWSAINGEVSGQKIIDSNISEYLDNLENGVYNISVQALGGNVGDLIYVNSNSGQSFQFAKLKTPEVKVHVEQTHVNLSISQDEEGYVDSYKVIIGNYQNILNANESLELSIEASYLTEGNNVLKVYALPKADDVSSTGVAYYAYENAVTNRVLNSEPFSQSIYYLRDIEQVEHSFDQNESVLVFDNVTYADNFRLFVGQEEVQKIDFKIGATQTTIRFSSLNSFAPDDKNCYNLTIQAFRSDGFAIESSGSKILKILDAPNAEESENGQFRWSEVEGDVIYSYVIYRTNNLGQNGQIVAQETTAGHSLLETLTFGYYSIEVVAISNDVNNYLDSNFYESEKILSEQFIVTEQINSPQITLDNQDGLFKLNIKAVDYASFYTVYLGENEIDAFSVSQEQEVYTRTLYQDFSQEQVYQISVIASAGENFDAVLHPEAEASIINITKIAAPDFSVSEIYSTNGRFGIDGEYGQKIEERLTLSNGTDDQFVKNYEIKINGDIVNTNLENYINLMGRGEQITLSLSAIAIDDDIENGNYYIDSSVNEVVVSRLSHPTNFDYRDGKIYFEQENSDQIENYFVEIELLIPSGNKTISFFTNSTEHNFDIQKQLEVFNQNKAFSYEFAQATKIGIKIFAYTQPKIAEGSLVLESLEGVSETQENQLIIEKMDSPVLTFTKNSLTGNLSWNRTGEETLYDIYNGQDVVLSNFSGNEIELSKVLNEVDLTENIATFKVIAKNSEYLNSSASNQINIAQLSSVKQIKVSKNQDVWQAAVSIDKPSDRSRIGQIIVCGEPISYQPGQSSALIDLGNYQDGRLTINLISKNNESEQIYYLDSFETVFTLADVSSKELNATILNDKLSWINPFEQWQFESGLVSFTIVITQGDSYYTISNISETSISLQDIEQLIQVELDSKQQITLSIYSQLAPFTISNGQSASYGQISQDIEVAKVESIENASLQIQPGSSDDLIAQQTESFVRLSFDNIWQEDVNFNVYINDELAFAGVSVSNPYNDCRVDRLENLYQIYINNTMFNTSGNHIISIVVNQSGKISSNKTNFNILRNSDLASASLSEQGMLSVNYGQIKQDNLVVKVSVGQQTYFEQFSCSDKEIDLSNLLQGKNGGVSIDLLVVSSTNSVLCSPTVYNISSTKLAAIQNITISDDGQISLSLQDTGLVTDTSNIEFIVKTEDESVIIFKPTQTEDKFIYTYSLQNFVKLLSISQEKSNNLALAVRAVGSLNSDFTNFIINYKIEETNDVQKKRSSQTSDYIIFDSSLQGDISTSGFIINILDNQNQVIETQTVIVAQEAEIFGFWDGNTNKFVLKNPNYSGDEANNVFECYALSINDILKNYDFGQFKIEVCRIAFDGKNHYIYSSKNFSLMKLNNVVEERSDPLAINIERNILSWNWIKGNELLPENFTPTAFSIKFWPLGLEIQTQELIVTGNSLDLSSINLAEGYNVLTIQAISQDENIIASSVLDTPIEPFKYYMTKPVTLENGKIVYNLNGDGVVDTSIDFVSVFDSSSGANIADNLDRIGEDGFKDIYYFQIGSVASQTIKLRFTSTDSQGLSSTGQTYYATVNAIDLLPNFSVGSENFLTQIKNYIDQHSESSEINFQQLVSFYQSIENMAQGLGDGKIIFDDFGKAIPAGYYNISICQTATNPLDDYIDSNYSSAKLIYLAPAPTMIMETQFNETSGEETYSANFNVVSIVNNQGVMQRAYDYVMLLRRNGLAGEENAYRFMITYDNGLWSITNEGQLIQNVISGNENNFTINYTELGDITNEDQYLIDKSYNYNVYIYAVGNEKSCFGKSSVMNLTFLSLSSSNISIIDGYFTLTTSQNEIGSDILVKYRRQYGSGTEAQETIIRANQNSEGKVILNDILMYPGLYDYVIFNVMGQIDNMTATMKLPSASYGVLNLYKLNNPNLTTTQNKLQISANASDQNYGSFTYRLENKELEINSTNQFFDANSGNLSTLILDHSKYDVNGLNYVSFIAPSITTINIIENETIQQNVPYFEYFINLDRVVLSSQSSQISLQKIENVSNFRVESGDLVWDDIQSSEAFNENVLVIYRLQVDYYDSAGYKGTENFYTCLNRFDTTLIQNIYSQGYGAYFNFSLYAYAGYAEGQTELVEGGYVDIVSQVLSSSGNHILHSSAATISSVVKQARPSFAIEQQIYQGKIAITRSIINLSFTLKLVDQNSTYELIEGKDFEVERDVIIFADNSQTNVYLISLTNESFATNSTFTLQITAYSTGSIKSDVLQSKPLYKLHSVDSSDIKINIVDEKNILDLTKYFEKYLYSYSNSIYQLEFKFADGSQFVLNSNNMIYGDAADENISLSGKIVEVVVKPNAEQSNYLSSNNASISFSNFDQEDQLDFAFNQENFRFEWGFGNNNYYQFYIELIYQNGESETSFIESYQVSDSNDKIHIYYYQPNKMGIISKINLFAREINQESDQFIQVQLFKKIDVKLENDIEYNLFESGNGTAYSPYKITNSKQFENISLRDDQNNQVYFELEASIEVTLSTADHLLNYFHGNLNGNGYTITVNFAKQNYQNDQNKLSLYLGGSSTSINFTNAQSLIGTISQSGIIENLNLELNQQVSGENYQPTIVSGLALTNYGKITNVNILEISSQYSSSLSSFAFAAIAGINYGTIENCQNNASSSHTYPSSPMILIYGGIALQNATNGIISGCLSNANISVVLRSTGSGIYGGGIVYDNNGGQVYACGNNGEIVIQGSTDYITAFGGVIGRNIGKIGYLFNNKNISSTNGGVAGIIYYYRSGQLGDMFELSGADVISYIYGNSANQQGNVYAYQNSTTGLTITLLPNGLASGEEFVYNNQFKLQVLKEDQKFFIELSKI